MQTKSSSNLYVSLCLLLSFTYIETGVQGLTVVFSMYAYCYYMYLLPRCVVDMLGTTPLSHPTPDSPSAHMGLFYDLCTSVQVKLQGRDWDEAIGVPYFVYICISVCSLPYEITCVYIDPCIGVTAH